ncbi:metallophosphoesterase family protein [Thomasclavelia cocleata]|jgi:hypothetical protein|nr:metallophosphoesterase [Thomasclavelia cocleata]MCR1960532.1 metallophosphoesterase [Thomasclavelia cocleata]NDO41501.1 metallophosphoesterase [Thomasclavelia cocleata]PJN81712.1 metallophosphoesterase [Thomasclavelia cocleata]
MKKIVVISDNHGQQSMLDKIRKLESDSDYYVHCGDSEALEERLKGWICVRGNNDWIARLQDEIVFEVEGVNFLVTHGHRYGYFNREEIMVDDLLRHGCDVLLSGHTHVPQCDEINGLYLINPGSTTLPRQGSNKSYCIIFVDQGEIKVEFKEII